MFLSHRYGTRCLPTRIIAKEFEIFREEFQSSNVLNEKDLKFTFSGKSEKRQMDVKNLLDECYELDDNEIPARYKLKFLEKLIPSYDEKVKRHFTIF